jgi:hypothetical protein
MPRDQRMKVTRRRDRGAAWSHAKKSSSTVDHLEARKTIGSSALGASSRQASSWEVSTSPSHQHAIIVALDRIRARDGDRICKEAASYLRNAVDHAMSGRHRARTKANEAAAAEHRAMARELARNGADDDRRTNANYPAYALPCTQKVLVSRSVLNRRRVLSVFKPLCPI